MQKEVYLQDVGVGTMLEKHALLIMDLIKQHRRKTSLRAALKFNAKLSFAEKILSLIVKSQTETPFPIFFKKGG